MARKGGQRNSGKRSGGQGRADERPHGRHEPDNSPGVAARRIAVAAIAAVLNENKALDETLDRLLQRDGGGLEPRDRGLARAIATVAIRRFGTIRGALLARLRSGMPERAGGFPDILVAAAAQLLFLDVPDHAAVDLAMRLIHEDREADRFASLANAVLRRVSREKEAILAASDPLDDDTPAWLKARWVAAWGEDTARAIAAAHRQEAAVDVTVAADPQGWAGRLDALLLPTGSLRLRQRTPVQDLPGYADGGWWIQDAAAALPAPLLGAGPGMKVADLCAAPGGKTAQLAATGADVLAVDRSEQRLVRLSANMKRLGFTVRTLAADATQLEETGFDAVLLDAPCSATGTLRRHPDVAWTKSEEDVFRLAALQTRLIDRAAAMLKPGGRLVFCTCSLEKEEGERQLAGALSRHPELRRDPVRTEEVPGLEAAVTAEGDVRTFPFMLAHEDGRLSGCDGFFVGRLHRIR
jgi:16S rRNA (cytosine967-C5)-methyltransferase